LQATLAPATLPAHLLAILTAPSKKAIVIVLEEFDVFASFGRGGRQMLLYCLRASCGCHCWLLAALLTVSLDLGPKSQVDVVQSIRPSLEGLSGRGVAVVGVTSRLVCLVPTLCLACAARSAPDDSLPLYLNRTRFICWRSASSRDSRTGSFGFPRLSTATARTWSLLTVRHQQQLLALVAGHQAGPMRTVTTSRRAGSRS
jgi:hypothetical protein